MTRKSPTAAARQRSGYEEELRLVDAHVVDAVLCWKWDRFIREPLDLEYLIPRCDKAGVPDLGPQAGAAMEAQSAEASPASPASCGARSRRREFALDVGVPGTF